ncbi:hypothetical protein [Sphingobium cupriresistens]|nr:hypothetical protein [Sphingobium cupriresistens]
MAALDSLSAGYSKGAIMVTRTTRTYRLTMSDRGLDLFLSCHLRLCMAARDLLSYGSTLQAAMMLFASRDFDEMVAELLDPAVAKLAGDRQHYVGASVELGDMAREIRARVSETGAVHAPSLGSVYIAALSHMSAVGDRELIRISCQLR